MFDKFCVNCNQNCKQCLGPKETDCTACDTSNALYSVFDSGRCSNVCFKGQQLVDNTDTSVFPVESNKICKKQKSESCDQTLCGGECMSEGKYCANKCAESNKAFSYFS